MFSIIGIVVVFAMVFGGYILAGGKMAPIIKAAPLELMMIAGAGLGALLIGNSGGVAKGVAGGLGKVFSGAKWKPQDYQDLLCLLYAITKAIKSKGLMSMEQHIENPHDSPLFQQYPKIAADHFAMDFICDTIRMMTMNLEDPHQVEDSMEKLLEKHHNELHEAQHAIQNLADALPALGIVAAVLGIVKTMGAINEPPEVLGQKIGAALVGTFLGVFLAYGFFGPFASRFNQVLNEDHQFYVVIQAVLVSHLHGNAPQVSVEVGRGSVPTHAQPSFADMEQAFESAPAI